MKKIYFKLVILTWLLFVPIAIKAQEQKENLRFNIELENQLFLHQGLYEKQKQNYFHISLASEYTKRWNNGRSVFVASWNGTIDQHDISDSQFDLPQLYVQLAKGNHDISVGFKQVFWGVTESVNLVNVINQTNYKRSFKQEVKLGQPMVHYSLMGNLGMLDLFLLPYYRLPVLPGEKGRLRTQFVINEKTIPFESKWKQFQPDFAVRWSHYFGNMDIGLSHFYGTSRQPMINENNNKLIYAMINQSAIDLQMITGPVLWKLEAIKNENKIKSYYAFVTGIEYTLSNIASSGMDVGLLGEYLYDSRKQMVFNSMQNDVFIGSRVAFNDRNSTQLLLGSIVDLTNGSNVINLKGSRRMGDSWNIEVEGSFFNNIGQEEFLYFMRNDSFVKLAVNKYF